MEHPVEARTSLRRSRRTFQLLIGLFLFGVGLAFLVRGMLGVSPWDVLTLGISQRIPLTFGTINVILSFVVLLAWIPLRQKPGVGTIANALLVGPSADIGLYLIPETESLLVRAAYVLTGIVLVGFSTGLYIGSRFGPGPRDGLMTGLHRVTGRPIWIVRTVIEGSVLLIGWLLGGTVGVGTVAFALLIGPVCQFFMPIFYVTLPSDSGADEIAPGFVNPKLDVSHVKNPAT